MTVMIGKRGNHEEGENLFHGGSGLAVDFVGSCPGRSVCGRVPRRHGSSSSKIKPLLLGRPFLLPSTEAGALHWAPYNRAKLSLQYTVYTQFNGGYGNYDGLGRNTSSNNTLYFLLWLAM